MRTKRAVLSIVPEHFLRVAEWRRAGRRFRACLIVAFATLAFVSLTPAGERQRLNAALLTSELGDPRAPGNVKLVLGLPGVPASRLSAVGADDFQVYVHPAGLSRRDGLDERYRADGLYLWRSRDKLFLDVRVVPVQEKEGQAIVRVVYAPGGKPAMEGTAEGHLRYSSDLVDVVLAVDISRSMLYNDPKKLRVAAARSFIEMARQGGGIGRVGLVTFNHRASKNTPLLSLDDGETLINALNRVGADGLTNLDHPLQTGLDELQDSRKPVIILLTDGKNEGSVYRDTHLRAAEKGVRIFTVGLSEQADHNLLRAMAEATGGIYFRAVKDSDLPDIYARLAAELGKRQLLRAETLRKAEGQSVFPIDSSVKRLIAMADGGARVGVTKAGSDGKERGGMFSDGMSAVQMGRPETGEWNFAWDRATPDVSLLALFGDTQFFLDTFPPQLIGDKLSVGATLAQGATPLGGAAVYVEPAPGIFAERLVLYDDGQHGDGQAGDGVYAGVVELPGAPDQFELTVRADGNAWKQGERFIRQSAGLVIRTPAPPPEATARISGEVDFGVLFPGETGSAAATIDLDSRTPRDLFMDLSWDGAGEGWPEFSSSVLVPPGRRPYQLEITVPENAVPGDYRGTFSVSDGDDIGDASNAKVTVGTITFDNPGGIDLGVVPPGTFVSREVKVTYTADKPAPLNSRVYGPDDLSVILGASQVTAGRGEISFEATVSAPIGMKDGEYSGRVVLSAGPGTVEIPLYWRVQPYATKAPSIAPVHGLPKAPKLPGSARPLEQTPASEMELWQPQQPPAHTAEPLDSPWEKTEKIFNQPAQRTGRSADPAATSGFTFPSSSEPRAEKSSFWSAWWLYILAALLLLLLLLLLLAYILYRLGKSQLARLLVVSALANIILLIVFILLLSTAESVVPRTAPTVTVTLVENDLPADVQLTPTEQGLLGGSSLDSGSNAGGGGESARMGEVAMAAAAEAAAASGGQLVTEKQVNLPNGQGAEIELADAREPSAMPLENRSPRSLQRRERQTERSSMSQAMPELPEMAEPKPDAGEQQGQRPEVGEARLEIEATELSARPVWSDGDKPLQPMASEQGVMMSEATGMEKVSLDRTASRIDPQGRRRNSREMPAANPEPRVDIADPVRDAMETAARAAQETQQDDPGVEEVRIAARSLGTDLAGEKPGSILPPGASRLDDSQTNLMPRGFSGNDQAERSLPRGGPRSSRGGSSREGSTLATPQSNGMPGGAASASSGGGAAAASRGTSGSGRTGGEVGEARFDNADGGGAEGGSDGQPNGTGSARSPSTLAGGGGGSSPSPLSGGGDGSERAEFTPGSGDGGGLAGGPSRNGQSRRGDRNGGGSPSGTSNVPGGTGMPGSVGQPGAQGAPGGTGNGGEGGGKGTSGRGQGAGLGEGRFDDMASAGDGSGTGGRAGAGIPGVGRSDLSGDGEGSGLGVIALESDGGEWRRNDRRGRRRASTVAASSVEADSLLLVVGDFSRLPDSAAENLFGSLAQRLGRGLTVEERRLSPNDANLSDTLLAIVSPEEAQVWSDSDVAKVAAYLNNGGHLWLDAASRDQAESVLGRLARATGGDFGPLESTHQLAEDEEVDALTKGDRLLAVATRQNWRKDWRYGKERNGRTLRFLIRGVNYFLSGNADTGITLEPQEAAGGRSVQPYSETIPETLAGDADQAGSLWDDFGPATAASWRMPSWSDPGRITAISDGMGGRALKMDLNASAKGRAAVYRTLTPPQNMTGAKRVSLDTYYDGGGDATLSMVLTIKENGGWKDYETPPVPLHTGWNSVQFDLGRDDFRSLSDGGGVGLLPPARQTGRAGFFVYRKSGTPAVTLFRNIRLHEK